MNHKQALLAAIVENPDDDTPRLIYADYIEGQGQIDRAEFIRVQCALAQLGEVRCERTDMVLSEYGKYEKRCKCRPCRLKQREYLCSRRHIVWEWNPSETVATCISAHYSWRRGFPEIAYCTCQSWLDHGAEVLRACPTIREARLSNRRPANRSESSSDGNNYYWIGDEPGWWEELEERLPYAIYNLLSMQDKNGWHFAFYKSEGKAYADLSQACLAYARNQLAKSQPVPT